MIRVPLKYCFTAGKGFCSDWFNWVIELRGDDEARYLEAVLSEENPNKCRELYPALRKAGDDIAEAEKDYIKKLEALDDDDEDGEDGETSNQLTLIVVFKYK